MSREVALTREEREARARVDGLGIDIDAFAAVSNVFRVANAVRNYMERNLLAEYRLSFSGFTVLWVLWVWGPRESHVLAEESGISKSTLTGVVKTLEGLGFAARRPHAADGRRVLVEATEARGSPPCARSSPASTRSKARSPATCLWRRRRSSRERSGSCSTPSRPDRARTTRGIP